MNKCVVIIRRRVNIIIIRIQMQSNVSSNHQIRFRSSNFLLLFPHLNSISLLVHHFLLIVYPPVHVTVNSISRFERGGGSLNFGGSVDLTGIQNGFSFKKGGKNVAGYGGQNQANIFAMAAAGQQRQDRGYYESLYHFDADVELAEYSLPVRTTQQSGAGKKGQGQTGSQQRVSSGVINATHLPPIGMEHEMAEEAELMDEMAYQMEMEQDPYGQEMEMEMAEEMEEEAPDFSFGQLKNLFKADEMKGKDHVADARKANFISKGSFIYGILQQIETGEQAISFFAKYGQSTPIKFVKCRRKPVGPEQFRPYDLIKVEDDDDNPKSQEDEYFTISAQGVVHVQTFQKKGSGVQQIPTEFMTLSQWMHQSTLFNVLTSMNFFKNYLISKVFALWKGNVRFKTYNRTRQQLAKNLIQMRPAFLDSFMGINKTLYDMKSKLTYEVPTGAKPYDISEFVDGQKKQRDEIKVHYNNCVEKIVGETLQNLIKSVTDSRNLKEEDDMEGGMDQANKHKSMNLMKQEKKLKDRVMQLAERNYGSLGTFIRLVDYMVVESQVTINQESADLILSEMNKIDRKYFIQTQVNFASDNDSMVFDPGQTDFISNVDKILQDMQSVTEDVQRVLTTSDFHQFIHGLINESGPRFRTIVEKSEKYEGSKQEITAKLTKDFQELTELVEAYKECRIVHEFDRDFNFEEWKQKNTDLDAIRTQLMNFKKWTTLLDSKIRKQESRGLIQIQGKKLQSSLMKRVKAEQKNLMDYLGSISTQRNKEITLGLNNIKNELTKQTGDLKAYVDYCSVVKTCQANADNINIQKGELEQIKGLLARGKDKDDTGISQKINLLQTQLENISTELLEIQALIMQADASIKEERTGNLEQLEQKIFEEQKKVKEYIEAVETQEVLLKKDTKAKDALDSINKIRKKFDESQRRLQTYKVYQTTLEVNTTPIPEIEKFEDAYNIRFNIWNIRDQFKESSTGWYNNNFREQDAEAIVERVQRDNLALKKLGNRLMDKKGMDYVDEVLAASQEEVNKVMDKKNLIQALGNNDLKEKHLVEIFSLLPEGHTGSVLQFSFQSLLDRAIDSQVESVEMISAKASGEANIETQIGVIDQEWSATQFTAESYRGMKGRYIIGKDVEEIIQKLEDDQMIVGNCMGSKYVVDIKPMVETWEKRLATISYVIDEMLAFQKAWMYLENIFNAEDIIKQLPNEAKKFKGVDEFWLNLMKAIKKDPTVQKSCDSATLLSQFQNNNSILDDIQNALSNYLDLKRSGFPRFYFLSDGDLLEILSQTRNAQAVQPHLGKCFDNMVKVEFSLEENSNEILAMISGEGEKVRFSEIVVAQGPVEEWLTTIEKMMQKTLYDIQKKCLEDYPEDGTKRDEWFFGCCAQAVITVDQIMWTSGVTEAINTIAKGKNKKALEEYLEFSLEQIDAMVALVRGDLNKLQRNAMGALIVIDVHARTVIENMMKSRVDNINHFDWTKQLRYYWELVGQDEPGVSDAFAKQTNTRFRYSYEYLGNGPRLVITPLTDKCYMTLTGALHLNFGGSPQGPAGTGKTETTKDLAKALAVQCVVFNCSDGLGIGMMAKFFSGLAQGGAWSCFDEFNRIEIEVLSVIAQQMLTIQSAVKGRKKEFEFEGKIIPLNLRFGVFITMNPGYAGRTELPDNLKALFRPVAMMIPNYALIAEIILFSEGFSTAHDLSVKMVKLYSLSSEQLSKQDHYDFGMRAVKSVLVMAGQLKRADPTTHEDLLLIRAMRDSNVPKFLEHDLPLFSGIVTDLFPGVEVPNIDYGDLEKAIINQLRLAKKQTPKKFVTKVIQLLETMMVRHGIMVVGVTGTGKTMCSSMLAKALTQLDKQGSDHYMHKPVHIDTLNPKSVRMGELYGETNPLTNEWTEGLVSSLVKNAVNALETDKAHWKRWIIFDGPVDAGWIENMNTVLDDNKMLCLANGQRIKMPATATMMFEVQDLKIASPATVSRCGMVYMEPVHLGWEPLIESWWEDNEETADEGIPEVHRNYIKESLLKVFTTTLPQIRKKCKEVIGSVDSNLVQSCLRILNAFLSSLELKKKDAYADAKKVVSNYLVFSIVWSLGANLFDDSRSDFNALIKPQLKKLTTLPDGDIYEIGINRSTHEFEPWTTQVPSFTYNPETSFFEILVPTSDTTKYKYILNTLVSNGSNVLITGETGVGKSVVTKDFLSLADADTLISACINFSGKTTTRNLLDGFEGNLDQKRKNLLGPPSGKKMIFFIDDVNMPQYDRFFSQPPCELLRQTIDQRGFYDVKKLFFKYIQNTSFIAACGPPSGGRNPVSPRLFRHFNMIWVPQLSESSMRVIFKSILEGFLNLHEDTSLAIQADPLIKASVELYQNTQVEFLPTPAKSHYTFNLRDLSKVVQGMLMMKLKNLKSKEDLVYLWIHETFRVFRDRLINPEDRAKYSEMAHEKLNEKLSLGWELDEYRDVMFGDCENSAQDYIKLSEANALIPRLENALDMHNAESSPMNLVFFSDCIQHLTRITRVLKQSRGNLLLVGVGGSGRRSMAKLGAHMQGMKSFQIEITKSYREKEYHEDIRTLLRTSGCEDEKIVFLFSDTQIVKESFLEDINNLINSGEIPRLFANEDKASIVEECSTRARNAGMGDSRDLIYAYFVQICRENLHIILAFSPVGDQFRNRCRQFPSITNCCTIDWYNPWPVEALQVVAHREFKANEEALGIQEHLNGLCGLCVEIHRSVAEASDEFYEQLRRKNYTTPTSYLDLLKTYKEMLGIKRGIVPREIEKYKNGLNTLKSTNEMVDQLKKELVVLLPQIDESTAETEKLVENLKVQQKDASEKEKVVQKETDLAKIEEAKVVEIKTECEAALAEAMPIYHGAKKALNTLSKDSIDEIKNYKTVGEHIQKVLSAVCLLFKKKEDFETAKKMMADPKKYIADLQSYNADSMPESMHKKLKKYTKDPELTPEILRQKSVACESICKFIRAMDNYVEVMKIIKPKQAALTKAEAELKVAQDGLKVKQDALKKVKDFVAGLERDFNEKQTFLESLNTKKANTELQLERADKLVSGLAGEAVRWKEAEARLAIDLVNLVGNILIAAGYVSYVGPFTATFRKSLIDRWMKKAIELKIPYSEGFTIEGVLGDPVTIREWNIQGLPADALSIENGIICKQAKRWALLIDPQSQGNKWIKNMEKDNNLQVTKLSNAKFLQIIEQGCKVGYPVLLENIDETLDPSLGPIMERDIRKEKGSWVIKLSDGPAQYQPEFNFIITTKLANPHYLPEICIKVTLINFTVTPEGLEDQLLVDVVKFEQPELEQQRDQLVVSLSDFNKQLKDLEAKILKLVGEAGADILDDEELIMVLDQSNETSITIKQKVEEAEETQKIINENRENYRGVARRGSVLYFVIADLGSIDPMYQYSLEFFGKLFNRRLDKSKKSKELQERLDILLSDITEAFYTNICRGLFEKDKLLYAYLNATSIAKRASEITFKEWSIYLRGSSEAANKEKKIDYVNDEAWTKLQGLEHAHENFENLTASFDNEVDQQIWKDIMLSDTPNLVKLPAEYEERLTPFQKLMIINVLRQEKLVQAMRKYVSTTLGDAFTTSPPFDLVGVWNDSTNTSPIIFVLSPGADPIADLMALAKARGFEARLKSLSLGQGQGPKAAKLIADGHLTGDWVCLQNCHLFASWMSELERIQEAQDEGTMHPEYRLWLTSEPSNHFPVPVLQSGIKLTNEPPRGLRANLNRTFIDISEEDYESCTKPKEYKKLLFALAYFHAAILERRKYGPIGWNIQYMWMNSDLETSKRQLKMYLDEQELVPYAALNYLVAICNYGGRVTDDKDERLITAMLRKYLCPEVIQEGYKLSSLDIYYAPPEGSLGDTKAYIESLPNEEDPEVFGLHSNANISYEKLLVGKVVDTIIALQPRVSSGGTGKTPDQIAQELAKEMLERLPKALDRDAVHESTNINKTTESGQPLSMNVFLYQEIDRFVALTSVIRRQLQELINAISGLAVMSGELEIMSQRFQDNKVPPKWEAPLGYPSLKPLSSWYDDLIARLVFMEKWYCGGYPDSYWLSAFFFPQGFMTASLQTYARKTQTPIDALKFKTNVKPFGPENVLEVPEDGVNIHGLFLQGARWDAGKQLVEDSEPRVPIVPFPCIWLEPVMSDENVAVGCYECPLYKTSARQGTLSTTGHSTNFVLMLYLPSELPNDYWVRRGAALLCMTDD